MVPRLSRLPELVDGPWLTLRRWRVEEASLLSEAVARNVEHLRPWMPWVGDEPLDVGRRRQLIEGWERAWIDGGDAVLGGCGLHHRCGPHGLEIGYWVDKDHLRRGVATEMARLLTTAAFTVEGITFVEIHHDEANVASGRIPKRLGFAFMVASPDGVQAPSGIGVEWRWRMEARAWRRLNASPT